eukprot:5851602-Pyramimonas_sp.AAC.1
MRRAMTLLLKHGICSHGIRYHLFNWNEPRRLVEELRRRDVHHRDVQTISSRHHGRHPPRVDATARPRGQGHGRRHCGPLHPAGLVLRLLERRRLHAQLPQAMQRDRVTPWAQCGPLRSTASDTHRCLSTGSGTPHHGARSLAL